MSCLKLKQLSHKFEGCYQIKVARLPRRPRSHLGRPPAGGRVGLGPHGLADGVNLGLPRGEAVHELLVLVDQLTDDLEVVGQRLLFQVGQHPLLANQPLHELVEQGQELPELSIQINRTFCYR